MTRAEDVWTKRALESLAQVPLAARDQIQALVGDICASPHEVGAVDLTSSDLLGRARVAVDGRATVFFEVVDEEIVRIVRVYWRA